MAIARRVADKATLANVLASTHLVTHGPDALHESLATARELGQLEDFAEQYPQTIAWRCKLASIYAQLGRSAHARQELDVLALADFSDLPRDASWLPSLSSLSEAVLFLDDVPRAQLLYKLLLPYAHRFVVLPALLSLGSASRPLGLLATTLSRFEDAERHFEHALTMNARIKAPIWVAQTEHDYAGMLLLRNRPGDRDKALELLNHAVAAAEELCLTALTDKARLLKLTTEAGVPVRNVAPSAK